MAVPATSPKSPRILFYDIETTQNVVAVFGLKNQDWINPDNILQERYIVSFAYKWLGEKEVFAVATTDDAKRYKKNPHDDFHVVQKLHEVLSSADCIVAHNGNSYDLKFSEGRMLIHGMDPLPPITKIDTLKTARERFFLNANNLNYLGKILGCGEKIQTSPGLWLRVLAGNADAVREMVKYNKQDVLLLEKVFLKLRPYMADHLNRQLYGDTGCPRCGSTKVQSRGLHRAVTQVYQRYQCQSCAGWFRELKAEAGSRSSKRVL